MLLMVYFLQRYRVILYRSPDLGQRTGSAMAQMLQRWIQCVALQPFSGADVCSQRGLKPGRLVCRMISLLTTADSKASLIQQRQQRI